MTSRDRRRVKLLEEKLDSYDSVTLKTGQLFVETAEGLVEVLPLEAREDPIVEALLYILRGQASIAERMIEAAERGWRSDPELWPPR